jgi:ribosomal-protein-alanine N-acetyltransferase
MDTYSFGLDSHPEFVDTIALVAKSHRKTDFSALKDEIIGSDIIRVKLLSSLICLSDLLDFDYRRVFIDKLTVMSIPIDSKFFWHSHYYVRGLIVKNQKIQLSFHFPAEYENTKLITPIVNYVQSEIKSQIDKLYNFLFEYNIRMHKDIILTKSFSATVRKMPKDLEWYLLGLGNLPEKNMVWENDLAFLEASVDDARKWNLECQKISLDFVLEKLERLSFLKDCYFERESISSHFERIAQSQDAINVFLIDHTVNISSIFYHEVKSLLDNKKTVVWVSSVSELCNYTINVSRGNLSEMLFSQWTEELLLFVDTIRTEKEIKTLFDLTIRNENLRIYTAVPNVSSVINNCESYSNISFYEINAIEDMELEEIVVKLAETKSSAIRASIFDIFRKPLNISFRSPALIKIIMSEMNSSGITLNHDDPLALFQIIDQYLKELTPSANKFFDKVADAILENNMNNISRNELDEFDKEINIFCSLGIIKKTEIGAIFLNTDYCAYIVARRFLVAKIKESKSVFCGFLSLCIPFLLKLWHTHFEELLLDECIKCDEKEKIIYLFINENKVLNKLFLIDEFKGVMLDIIKYSTEVASYDVADKLISVFDNNVTVDDSYYPRYRAKKMYYNYLRHGCLVGVDDINDSDYLYVKAYIKYCTDNYEEAVLLYQSALDAADSTSTDYREIRFDYMETLLDSGKLSKAKALLSDVVSTHFSPKESILLNNLKGELYKFDVDFEASETFFISALNKAYSIYDKKRIAKTHGDLGELYMYWGKYCQAEEHIKTNIKISHSCHDYNGIAASHQLLANLMLYSGKLTEAYWNFSYSIYFASTINNNWRLINSLIGLNLFDTCEQLSTFDIEQKISKVNSKQYHAFSYLKLALNVIRNNADARSQARKYLLQSHSCATSIGNNLVSTLAKSMLEFLENGIEGDVHSDLKSYCVGLNNVARELIGSENGLQAPKCLLPFYKYREMETERINLVSLTVRDANDIFDYASRNLTTQYVSWPKHKTISDSISYINNSKKLEIKGNYYLWGIRCKYNRRIIGTVDLYYNDIEDDLEFGIIISDDYWKFGYASETLKKIIEFCMSVLKIHRITGICFSANQRSVKMMERHGFVFEKSIPNYHNEIEISDKSGSKFSLIISSE